MASEASGAPKIASDVSFRNLMVPLRGQALTLAEALEGVVVRLEQEAPSTDRDHTLHQLRARSLLARGFVNDMDRWITSPFAANYVISD